MLFYHTLPYTCYKFKTLAPFEGLHIKKVGFPLYCSIIAFISFSTAFLYTYNIIWSNYSLLKEKILNNNYKKKIRCNQTRTTVTVHPPKPPPTIRDPRTPSMLRAIFTKLSNSGHDTSYRSLRESCEAFTSSPN